jgi:lipopolysaccharide assembly outer membrane protein LptD (OstA)
LSEWADRSLVLRADEVDYHGDGGIVEPRGNVRIQTKTPAQGILSAIEMFQQLALVSFERSC